MGNVTRNKSKVILNTGYKVYVLIWACLAIPVFLIQGCAIQGEYMGRTLSPPVMKVVLFEIEGTDGKEFTQMLATRLTKMGKTVVHGNQFGEPADLMVAAKIARDNQAGAFIRGRLTTSEIVDLTKYTVSGTFTLHEVEAGDQIGGIANVSYTEDTDPLLGLGKILSGLSLENRKKFEDEKIKGTKVKSVQCRFKLAEHVSSELCCKGLGGMAKGHDTVAHHHGR